MPVCEASAAGCTGCTIDGVVTDGATGDGGFTSTIGGGFVCVGGDGAAAADFRRSSSIFS